MITPNVRLRDLRIEDNPAPSRSSSYFVKHFGFFGLQPEGKTIKNIVLELKIKVREAFIRNCHLQPETYSFSDFRKSKNYRLQRELMLYLSRLSSWLYQESKYPPSLKKAFSKINCFQNPYQNFRMSGRKRDLSVLDDLSLTIMYNLDICSSKPSTRFRTRVLEEFTRRGIDSSSIDPEERILIENLNSTKPVIAPLKDNLQIS